MNRAICYEDKEPISHPQKVAVNFQEDPGDLSRNIYWQKNNLSNNFHFKILSYVFTQQVLLWWLLFPFTRLMCVPGLAETAGLYI